MRANFAGLLPVQLHYGFDGAQLPHSRSSRITQLQAAGFTQPKRHPGSQNREHVLNAGPAQRGLSLALIYIAVLGAPASRDGIALRVGQPTQKWVSVLWTSGQPFLALKSKHLRPRRFVTRVRIPIGVEQRPWLRAPGSTGTAPSSWSETRLRPIRCICNGREG